VSLLYAYNDLDPQTAVLQANTQITIGFSEDYAGIRYIPGFPSARVRPDGVVVHKVNPGDTLIGIAITYGLTLEELYDQSGLSSESFLVVDQEVKVAQTPIPQAVGGSTIDETATPSPTATATPSSTPTSTPLATIAPSLNLPPAPTPTLAIASVSTTPPQASDIIEDPDLTDESGNLLIYLLGGIVALLLLLGGMLIYAGRR
jgi:LysM repeat protein